MTQLVVIGAGRPKAKPVIRAHRLEAMPLSPYAEGDWGRLYCGDAAEVLTGLPTASCDALISDPPAAIAMMNMAWDRDKGGRDQWITWLAGIMAKARRCVKPGGHALVWALPRTSHWTGMALEQAGWRVVDVVTHVQSQGFPKSRSLLKPAAEHWILCRAPGPRQELNVDACRVPTGSGEDTGRAHSGAKGNGGVYGASVTYDSAGHGGGRWPSNLVLSHVGGPDGCRRAGVRRVPSDTRGQGRPRGTVPHSDDAWGNGHLSYTGAETAGDGSEMQQEYLCHPSCPIRLLDEQAGPRASGTTFRRSGQRSLRAHPVYGTPTTTRHAPDSYGDGATNVSRFFPTFPCVDPDPEDADGVAFFYAPKAPPSERRLPDGTPTGHPTQKPLALCSWLVTLVCGENGVVLDPFAGVASIGCAAITAGRRYSGIEQDAGYCRAARTRLEATWERHTGPLFCGAAAERE